ncbi:DUF58 domain-containing protein [Geminocystis sp. NIES-3709]|uniref:DUF58 domain-containing protein n=1 Tax=Geminocystis sp. NIES-3709 TaxID=1617448 RepID=UPI0005FC658F|nr:DUF58 domain-containing protein [Geminocystis sp. NIES-3709]BAQ66795.1 hypothetical protein GM3709_3560 [Geminocystis sp. NIES-3709]
MKNHSSSRNNFIIFFFHWLENRWATPAYSGWILIGIALSFFGAATNTMAGWLYVLSGILLSLLALNLFVAINTLKQLQVKRSMIEAISAGNELTIELVVSNPTKKTKTLIEIIDELPLELSGKITHRIESLPPQTTLKLISYAHTKKRGIYHWYNLQLKTAAPFGLFYSTRQKLVESKAIVYPQVLPLQTCPLIDTIGSQETKQQQSERLYQNATEGVTKALRQYRYGDPIRLIHWRSSARFGDLQVRELETITGGEEIIICLDNSSQWQPEYFETAVIAAASMYFYASRQQLEVRLWTADKGLIRGSQVMLETLAGIDFGVTKTEDIPLSSVIWLSQNPNTLSLLSPHSRWLLFPSTENKLAIDNLLGIFYDEDIPLQTLLQKPL